MLICYYSFKIVDLEAERKYMVNLDLSICMETNGTCEISVPVLVSTLLPKPVCNWDNDFVISSMYYISPYLLSCSVMNRKKEAWSWLVNTLTGVQSNLFYRGAEFPVSIYRITHAIWFVTILFLIIPKQYGFIYNNMWQLIDKSETWIYIINNNVYYVFSAFSFSGFLTEKGIAPNGNLDANQLSALMERLAISDFLLDTQCSSSNAPYSGSSNGWTNSKYERQKWALGEVRLA